MNKVLKGLRAGALAIMGFLSTGITMPAQAQETPATVKIAILTTGAPFSYKEGGVYKGFEVDLIEAIAKQAKFQVEWNDLKFEAMIPALQAQQVDAAVASFFVREERKKVIDFSTPYYHEGNVLAVPVESPIKTLADIKDKAITAKKGAAGLVSAQKLAKEYGATVRILDDEPNMYLEVQSGNAVGVVHDSAILGYKIKLEGDKPTLRFVGDVIDTADVAMAFPKGSPLTAVFNDGIVRLKASGELQAINDKYFGK